LLEELGLPVPRTHDFVLLGTTLLPHHPEINCSAGSRSPFGTPASRRSAGRRMPPFGGPAECAARPAGYWGFVNRYAASPGGAST
jgi:hypothetical protein